MSVHVYKIWLVRRRQWSSTGQCFESSIVISTAILEVNEDNYLEIWGTRKRDLHTVKITCIGSNKVKPLMQEFSNAKVKYIPLDSEKECRATIYYFERCSLSQLEASEEDLIELRKKLEPLKEELQPLMYMYKTGDSWDIELERELMTGNSCKTVMMGFLHNMDDTSGKEAMRSITSQILSLLELTKLSVVQTGSTSHMNRFAASTILQTMAYQETSSSSDNITTDDSNYSPEEKQKAVLDNPNTPVTRQTTRDQEITPPSGGSSSDDYDLKSHLTTPDVLIFYQPHSKSQIQTKMVINVKKGSINGMSELVKELLSRLPYQPGPVFGLHINAFGATLCSVEHIREGDSGDLSDKLKLYIYKGYPTYTFNIDDQPFSFESFWDMILDIGAVLFLNRPK